MIEQIFDKIDIPIESILNELDTENLLIIHFSLINSNLSIKELLSMNSAKLLSKGLDIDEFMIKNISKEKVINEILKLNTEPSKINILKEAYLRKSKNQLLNTIIVVIEHLYLSKVKNQPTKVTKDDFINKFFKDYCYKNKEYSNILALVILLGILDEPNEIFIDEFVPYIFKVEVLKRLFYFSLGIQNKELKKLQTENKLLEKKNSASLTEFLRKDERYQKVKNDFKNANAKIKDLESQISSFKKQPGSPELMSQLYDDIQKKDAQIQKLVQDIKNIKEKPIKTNNALIENLNNQIVELKKNNDAKKEENRKLKYELQKYEGIGLRSTVLEYLKNNWKDEVIIETITELYSLKEKELEYQSRETIQEEPKNILKIGYCIIKDNEHYLVSPNSSEQKILNIPNSIYFAQGQFICIDNQGNYKWNYQYKVEIFQLEKDVDCYSQVIIKDNEPYIYRGSHNLVKVKSIPPNISLREKQIISVDEGNNFIRFYRQFKVNADNFMDSIKAKGQTAAFVLKTLPTGLFIRDIISGEETFKTFSNTKDEFLDHQIIMYINDEIINKISYSKFYTNSTFYSNVTYGTVEIEEDVFFVKKLSGEKIIINEVPPTINLQPGDVIGFDEFNNYIMLKESIYSLKNTNKTTNNKKSDSNISYIDENRIAKFKLSEDSKTVAVIGNKKLENSYKQSLYLKGYNMSFVDGYETWININHEIKKADIVVIVTKFISHKNMEKVRSSVKDIEIIYSEFDGANRIADEVDKIGKKSNIS